LRPGSAPSIATDIAPTSSRIAVRPQSRGMQTGIIVILVLAVIVLIGVFVWVLMAGGGEKPSSKRPNAERVSQLEVLRPTEAPGTMDSHFRT
jgi:flagellar basal body-associated protein FliL